MEHSPCIYCVGIVEEHPVNRDFWQILVSCYADESSSFLSCEYTNRQGFLRHNSAHEKDWVFIFSYPFYVETCILQRWRRSLFTPLHRRRTLIAHNNRHASFVSCSSRLLVHNLTIWKCSYRRRTECFPFTVAAWIKSAVEFYSTGVQLLQAFQTSLVVRKEERCLWHMNGHSDVLFVRGTLCFVPVHHGLKRYKERGHVTLWLET
jgi:hypothetical protein